MTELKKVMTLDEFLELDLLPLMGVELKCKKVRAAEYVGRLSMCGVDLNDMYLVADFVLSNFSEFEGKTTERTSYHLAMPRKFYKRPEVAAYLKRLSRYPGDYLTNVEYAYTLSDVTEEAEAAAEETPVNVEDFYDDNTAENDDRATNALLVVKQFLFDKYLDHWEAKGNILVKALAAKLYPDDKDGEAIRKVLHEVHQYMETDLDISLDEEVKKISDKSRPASKISVIRANILYQFYYIFELTTMAKSNGLTVLWD